MKWSTAKDRLSDDELLGGAVCISCMAFVAADEERYCGCPVGYLGSYRECPDCGDVYFDDGGPNLCRPCADARMNRAIEQAAAEHGGET